MAAMSAAGAAEADAHARSAAIETMTFFMLARVNSAIAAFNPAADAAFDVHDVSESGHRQQLRRDGAVGGALAVHEDGLVLIRQQLRQLALDRSERSAQRSGDVPVRSEISLGGTDIEHDDLRRV